MFKLINKCRICNHKKLNLVINLGKQPPANSLTNKRIVQKSIPLTVIRCNKCKTLQLNATINRKLLFSKYLWVTGTSNEIKTYRNLFVNKIKSQNKSFKKNILEIASNDGYFLKKFKKHKFNVLGIDPATNIARKANNEGIKTIPKFFNLRTSALIKKKYFIPDILICRNVIPHVENINEIIKSITELVHSNGKVYIEFHYARNMSKYLHYDYIYHEHIFYFTIHTMIDLLKKHGLYSNDYFLSPISGGSIVLVASKNNKKKSKILKKIIKHENKTKMNSLRYWKNFKFVCKKHSKELKSTITKILKKNKKIYGYGASARSSTLLNYSKINYNHIPLIFDRNPLKHNLFTAGSKIKIIKPKKELFKNVDYILLLAWNFKKEIIRFLKNEIKFKGKIIDTIPRIKILK